MILKLLTVYNIPPLDSRDTTAYILGPRGLMNFTRVPRYGRPMGVLHTVGSLKQWDQDWFEYLRTWLNLGSRWIHIATQQPNMDGN